MSSNTITYASEPLLTQHAIRQGIFDAVKLKSNYNLLINEGNKNKTGGIFTDSTWLKTNYDSTNNKQFVVGKLLHDISDNTDYIKGDQFNTVMGLTETINVNPSSEMKAILGLANQTELNKIPILDTKHVFMKMVHDDAELYNMKNKSIDNDYDISNDINIQRIILAGYDVVTINNNAYISEIYSISESSQTKLIYSISGNQFTITNKTNDTIYYPTKLVVKTIDNSDNRYEYDTDNTGTYIKKIDNVVLNSDYKIYCDFEQYPKYTYSIYTLNE